MGLSETEVAITKSAWVILSPLHVLWFLAWYFVGLLTVGVGVFLAFSPALQTLFLLLGYLVQADLLHLVMLCSVSVPGRSALF